MAVQVVTLANPAVGHDWSYVVPGQWFPYLYGVTAVLNTGGSLDVYPDATATANNMTVSGNRQHFTQGAAGPFAGGANNFAVASDGQTMGAGTLYARGSVIAGYGAAAMSLDWWMKPSVINPGVARPVFAFSPTATTLALQADIVGRTGPGYQLQNEFGATHATADTVNPFGAWQHRAEVWDGVNVVTYLNGVSTGSVAQAAPGALANSAPTFPSVNGNSTMPGSVAGFAIYGAALTAGQVAAHYAAAGSASAYQTAVLGDSPQGLWMLSGVRDGPSRNVVLQLTNGTAVVAAFPATLAATTAPTFTYSWQNLGPSAATTVDNSTVTVPIPELAVAAGYVIRTNTLDLSGTDQWSEISLWFDDGQGTAGTGGGSGETYLDALLVPTDWTG